MKLLQNLSDWNIKRDKVDKPSEGLTHSLWETNGGIFGFYFYNIGEYGMMKHYCKLQILKDKTNPKVVYEGKDVAFIYDPYSKMFTDYDWTDQGILVLRQLLDNGYKNSFVIINLDKMSFISLEKSNVKLELHENKMMVVETIYKEEDNSTREVTKQINLDKTYWKPLNELTN